ncbi:uncharacterized protein VP01_7318g1, partial [Puccinia sorghi]
MSECTDKTSHKNIPTNKTSHKNIPINKTSRKNIPLLDDTKFAAWSYVTEPPDLTQAGVISIATRDKLAEAMNILIDYLSELAFDAVVTPSNEEDPHALWNKIISQYSSTSVNNKGRVWLKFMRYEYNGQLKTFITDISHLLNEIAVVKLGVPNDVLCFSILAKLSEDMHNVVENIIMSEYNVTHPDATLSKLQELVYLEESRKTKNPKPSPTLKLESKPPDTATVLYTAKTQGLRKPLKGAQNQDQKPKLPQ